MSELQNPLFDEEKEFLERKKREYERALRGDIDHIKEQSAKVGKVELCGALAMAGAGAPFAALSSNACETGSRRLSS